jgi:hypothetical protein
MPLDLFDTFHNYDKLRVISLIESVYLQRRRAALRYNQALQQYACQ